MKMQVLYSSKTGNAQLVADKVSRIFKCKCDQIPPAYLCENEKLVLIVLEHYGKFDKQLIAFCKDLSSNRASNVALIALSNNGSTEIGELAEIFKNNGVKVAKVCGLTVHKGLFGKGKVTDAHISEAGEFAKSVAESIFEKIEY